ASSTLSDSRLFPAFRTPSTLERMPPPASAICSKVAPEMRCSKSIRRGVTNAGCVWESTNPGVTTWFSQSISTILLRFFLIQGSRRARLVVPTETILPASHSTAASSIIPSSLRSAPRRGPDFAERKVRSWPMLTSNRDDVWRGVGRIQAISASESLRRFSSRTRQLLYIRHRRGGRYPYQDRLSARARCAWPSSLCRLRRLLGPHEVSNQYPLRRHYESKPRMHRPRCSAARSAMANRQPHRCRLSYFRFRGTAKQPSRSPDDRARSQSAL